MNIYILTLFPKMFEGPLSESILKRAQEKGMIKINLINIRDFTNDKHHTVDEKPYGGGPGMVMKVDVIDYALQKVKEEIEEGQTKIVLMTPQGRPYSQAIARDLSHLDNLIIIAGHFEGYDERIRKLVDEEISIGPYVLTGGEIPAMVLIDSISRLVPGVIGKAESLEEESFSDENLLEYPQYTRPEEYKGEKVPEILLSGNHEEIRKWRKEQAEERTAERKKKHTY